jgi:hypothetical protein
MSAVRSIFVLLICMTAHAAADVVATKASTQPAVAREGVALSFVEVGEFRAARMQGVEIDLVNSRKNAVTCDVTMILQRASGETSFAEVARTERKAVSLPPGARAGFRVSEPLTFGRCRVDVSVKIDGQTLDERRIEFAAAGPYRITTRPYLLGQNAILVRVENLMPAEARSQRYRVKLVTLDGKTILSKSNAFRQIPNTSTLSKDDRPTCAETLLSFGDTAPAGDYRVELDVLADDVETKPQT